MQGHQFALWSLRRDDLSPPSPRPPSLFQVFTPSFDSLMIMSTKKVTNKIKQEVTQGGEHQ